MNFMVYTLGFKQKFCQGKRLALWVIPAKTDDIHWSFSGNCCLVRAWWGGSSLLHAVLARENQHGWGDYSPGVALTILSELRQVRGASALPRVLVLGSLPAWQLGSTSKCPRRNAWQLYDWSLTCCVPSSTIYWLNPSQRPSQTKGKGHIFNPLMGMWQDSRKVYVVKDIIVALCGKYNLPHEHQQSVHSPIRQWPHSKDLNNPPHLILIHVCPPLHPVPSVTLKHFNVELKTYMTVSVKHFHRDDAKCTLECYRIHTCPEITLPPSLTYGGPMKQGGAGVRQECFGDQHLKTSLVD